MLISSLWLINFVVIISVALYFYFLFIKMWAFSNIMVRYVSALQILYLDNNLPPAFTLKVFFTHRIKVWVEGLSGYFFPRIDDITLRKIEELFSRSLTLLFITFTLDFLLIVGTNYVTIYSQLIYYYYLVNTSNINGVFGGLTYCDLGFLRRIYKSAKFLYTTILVLHGLFFYVLAMSTIYTFVKSSWTWFYLKILWWVICDDWEIEHDWFKRIIIQWEQWVTKF